MFLPSSLGQLTIPDWSFPRHQQVLQNAVLQTLRSTNHNRLIVQMPIRHGKSCNNSILLPSWHFLVWPHKSIIHLSATADLSSEWGHAIRQRIERYGYITGVKLDSAKHRTDNFWMKDHPGRYFACGVGGTTSSRGCDLLLCDDIIANAADAASDTMRDNIWRWFWGEGLSRLEPGAKVIVTMSRRGPDDLLGRCLAMNESLPPEDQWHELKMPALDENNNALWPERWPAEKLLRIKAGYELSGQEHQWSGLYQQEGHMDPTQVAWPDEYWKNIWYDELPPDIQNHTKYRVIAIDPSCGKLDKIGDYTALVYCIITTEDDVYVHDAVLQRIPQGQIADTVAEFTRQHRPDSTICEINGFQQSVALLIGQAYKAANIMVPLHWLETRCHKETKIRSTLSPLLRDGKIKLRKGLMGTKLLLKQLREFPSGSHDDGPDALSIAYRHVFGEEDQALQVA